MPGGNFENYPYKSHPVRGAWIEISKRKENNKMGIKSHPVRGAWIEMLSSSMPINISPVAPRQGCVD